MGKAIEARNNQAEERRFKLDEVGFTEGVVELAVMEVNPAKARVAKRVERILQGELEGVEVLGLPHTLTNRKMKLFLDGNEDEGVTIVGRGQLRRLSNGKPVLLAPNPAYTRDDVVVEYSVGATGRLGATRKVFPQPAGGISPELAAHDIARLKLLAETGEGGRVEGTPDWISHGTLGLEGGRRVGWLAYEEGPKAMKLSELLPGGRNYWNRQDRVFPGIAAFFSTLRAANDRGVFHSDTATSGGTANWRIFAQGQGAMVTGWWKRWDNHRLPWSDQEMIGQRQREVLIALAGIAKTWLNPEVGKQVGKEAQLYGFQASVAAGICGYTQLAKANMDSLSSLAISGARENRMVVPERMSLKRLADEIDNRELEMVCGYLPEGLAGWLVRTVQENIR